MSQTINWHLHTDSYSGENLVSSQVLVTALLRHQVARITLDITIHSTPYTDARRGIMLQRSGGLEKSKFPVQRAQTSSIH